jgi:diguanylate cyclase (GGDEF)-like protein
VDGDLNKLRNRRDAPWGRSSLVFPVGIIVTVAFICVTVAAVGSARRADEVAVEQETQRFTAGIKQYGDRLLREVMGVSADGQAIARLAAAADGGPRGGQGAGLRTFSRPDVVFVLDGEDRLLATAGLDAPDAATLRADLKPVLDIMRGVQAGAVDAVRILAAARRGAMQGPAHATVLQSFGGRPALVAGAAVVRDGGVAAPRGAAVVAVRRLDHDVLADLAARLQLRNLRLLTPGSGAGSDHIHEVVARGGAPVARFAWTAQNPGAEIVASVLPFIVIAFFGLLLLAAFVTRHMRRTERTIVATEQRLRHLAMHDPLCGLPNRIFFSERLERVIDHVQAGGDPAAVLYIDLDHFKDVNDLLGHPVGDELIEAVALRLRRVMRESDVVARLGGDEFAVIRTLTPDMPDLDGIAERIIAALCAPYALADQSIVIGASIGITVVDCNACGAADVMRHADMALYRAKNEGRNRACIYDAAMDAHLVSRKMLQDDLRRAIADDGLRLDYQPVVNASGEKVIGVEALARWRHPERGEISPAEFIPVAENCGLIIDLGVWVLRRACSDGLAWPNLTVAVNVSPMQFRRTDFVDVVEQTLAETGFDPSRLELEVTESTLLGNVETAQAAMLRLKALGVKLALDDFGTGYSSLQYLRRFPFDRLKIDHSFVRSIENASDAAAIVHAIVSLGRGLGMKVTAEGVETAEQQLFLRAAGVHAMQGFRFGRPAPAAEITGGQMPEIDLSLERYAVAR